MKIHVQFSSNSLIRDVPQIKIRKKETRSVKNISIILIKKIKKSPYFLCEKMILIKNIQKSVINDNNYNSEWFSEESGIINNNFTGDEIVVTDDFTGDYTYKNSQRIDCKISGSSRNQVTIYIIAPETKIETDDYTIDENKDLIIGNIKVIIYSRNDISDRPIRIYCGTYKNKEIFFKGNTIKEQPFTTVESPAEFIAVNILPLLLKYEVDNNLIQNISNNLIQISNDYYRWGNESIVKWTEDITNFYEYVVDFNGFCTERVGDEYRICKSGNCEAIIGQEKTIINLSSPVEKNFLGDVKISIKNITYKKYRPRWCKEEILVHNFTPQEKQVVITVDTGVDGEFTGKDYEWQEGDIAYIGSDEKHIYRNGQFIIETVTNPGINRIKLVNFVFGDTIPTYGSIVKKNTPEKFYYYERNIDEFGEEIINYYEPGEIIINNGEFDFRGFKINNPNVEAFLIFCGFTIDQWAVRNTTESEPNRLKNLTVLGNKKIKRNSPLDDFVTINETQYKIHLFPLLIDSVFYSYDQATDIQLITRNTDRNGFYFDLDFEDLRDYKLINLKEIKKAGIFIGVSLIDRTKDGIIQDKKYLFRVIS